MKLVKVKDLKYATKIEDIVKANKVGFGAHLINKKLAKEMLNSGIKKVWTSK